MPWSADLVTGRFKVFCGILIVPDTVIPGTDHEIVTGLAETVRITGSHEHHPGKQFRVTDSIAR